MSRPSLISPTLRRQSPAAHARRNASRAGGKPHGESGSLRPAVALLLLTSAVLLLAASVAQAEDNQRRFLRAAYVLRLLAPDEGWAQVSIPPYIRRDDQASTLLHHSDRLFVFLSLARELDALGREGISMAAHFAAHAYRLAGKAPEAARSMQRHVRQAPFKAEDRLFLLQRLYELKQYAHLREAALEWERLDGVCREPRMRYVWESYAAQGLYQEALDSARFSNCPGWLAPVLSARARYLLGEKQEAMAEVAAINRRFPGDTREIAGLWQDFEAARAYP